jgi:putative ABC transport system substrate-binding protein
LVSAHVDVILAGNTAMAVAARNATRTIPIVMAGAANPVAGGLIASYARPGGNVTGVTLETAQLTAKRIELLKEALPSVRRVAALYPGGQVRGPILTQWIRDSEAAARQLGLSLELVELGLEPGQWEQILQAVSRRGIAAATIIETPTYLVHRAPLAEAALKAHLPVMFPFPEQAEAGGLMAYGADGIQINRRAADFVGKLLKGHGRKTSPSNSRPASRSSSTSRPPRRSA